MFQLLSDLRAWLIKTIGRPLAALHETAYVTATTQRREFVGVLDMSEAEAIDLLLSMDFEPNYLAARKSLANTDEHGIGSWAWRGHIHDDGTREHDPFAPKQLHVNLWELDERDATTVLTAHWEDNWLTRPFRHYRGANVNDAKGVSLMRLFLRSKLGDSYEQTVDHAIPDSISTNES